MAELIRCDKCGEIQKIEKAYRLQFYTGIWDGSQTYDLCYACYKKFKGFFKDGKEETKENS